MAADDSAARMARALYEARDKRVPIAPLTDADPTMGMDDGYLVQREFTSLLVADGDSVIGYKAGLTSAPMQDMFGVSTPDYGPVMATTIRSDGATISLDDFIAPKVEAEIVFRLAAPLRGPGVTVEQAHAAIGAVMAGLEIVDSRIENWRIKLADTIADLASCGAAVLGQASRPVTGAGLPAGGHGLLPQRRAGGDWCGSGGPRRSGGGRGLAGERTR